MPCLLYNKAIQKRKYYLNVPEVPLLQTFIVYYLGGFYGMYSGGSKVYKKKTNSFTSDFEFRLLKYLKSMLYPRLIVVKITILLAKILKFKEQGSFMLSKILVK